MINPNAWYIAMHLDRLNEELLSDTYGKQKEKKSEKKKPQTENNKEHKSE